MKNLLALAASLALAAPAGAQLSDAAFADSLNRIHAAAIQQSKAAKDSARTALATAAPNDPLLLAQKPLIDMIKKVEPSVVFLMMTIKEADKSKPAHATCAGFFTDASRELGRPSVITTNAHCVEQLPVGAEIEIGLYDGNDNRPKMTKGRVLAYGSSRLAKDVAFVELLDPSLNRRPLPLWNKVEKGETVVAIGNPLGMTYSASLGIISGLGRDHLGELFVLDMNQADVAVNPGNSGGPLFNMWGSVVGINTMIASNSGGFEGISLSVPAGYVSLAMQQYKRTGNLKPGALQLEISASTTTKSLTAGKATPGGPAEAAKIQPGDLIVKVDGLDLSGLDPAEAMKTFLVYVKYRSPGEIVTVTVRRGGKDTALPVTLAEGKPPEPPKPEWAPIPPKEKKAKPGNMSWTEI